MVSEIMKDSDTLTQGKHMTEFEAKYSDYIGVNHAFAVSSATSALEIAAQLCLFENGDEVIIPGHTYTATAYPFVKHGANIVWADIDLETRVINSKTIEKCITDHTKAVVVVHLYGYAANMDEIKALTDKHNLILIEDCAQALGTEYESKKIGSFGDFGIFSHHSQKNISTLGEGGALVLKDSNYANLVPMLRHNGHSSYPNSKEYWKPAMSNVVYPQIDNINLEPNNFCLGEVQCALGTMILDRVEEVNDLKRERAIYFIDSLKDFDLLKFHRVESKRHNYQHLVAEVSNDKRDIFLSSMAYQMGIQCITQYYPLYRYPYYIDHGLGQANCPNTDKFFDNMVSFPFYEVMSDSDLEYMIDSSKVILDKIQ
jgi:dTDP-4-amino-4,6-dideoxygalactose transaminase